VEATATAVPNSPGIPSSPTPEAIDSNREEAESPQSFDASATASDSPHPWDQPIPGTDFASASPPIETPPAVKPKSKRSLLPLVVAGAGLSLSVFFTSLYVLSRPCAFGSCNAIPEAQELSKRSTKTLQNPQSGKEVLEAQQQLNEAIQILESIPLWSGSHGKAQELLKAYQAQAQQVNDMVKALKNGAQASYKSENPPHPASQWIEIQGLWRSAIAQLEDLPTDSTLKPLAQQKIKLYKANLAQTNQRLLKERQAQGTLQVAKDAALIAEARQGVAQSLDHWQLVYATWQMALKRLKEIPQGTMAYDEAKQLSANYLSKMANARDRKTKEQIAANAYNQGLRFAQLAKESQANNQWSVALTHWRNAVTYMNQVPSDSFYYRKAKSLAASYKGGLKQAQAQLQILVKLQQARSDLKQTCTGKINACSYTVNNNVIQVRLTPSYTQMVRLTALTVQARGDSTAQAGLVNHILTLGEALEAISNNARIRVEVYASDGSLIQTHMPRT
jgi:hypothetical protein